MSTKRLDALRESIARSGWDCIALVPGANLYYFTGLRKSLSERPLVAFFPVQGPPHLLLPSFESLDVRQALPFHVELYKYSDTEGHDPAFEHVCRDLDLAGARIGVEYLSMRVMEREQIARYSPGATFENADTLIAPLRMVKDAGEIALMQEAAQLNEAALQALLAHVRPGITEKELDTRYRIAAWQAGAGELAFDPIIAAGPNSALPHTIPGAYTLRSGDFVTVDCGVRHGAYCSDITRTLVVGSPTAEMVKIYETVRAANAAARAAVRPGVPAQEIDRAARRVIEDAGYGARFTHRTGHGLGLDIHEAPYITQGNELLLEPGMIFTIEPGIYIAGLGGVRIEDEVCVTEKGCETLTSLPRDLLAL